MNPQGHHLVAKKTTERGSKAVPTALQKSGLLAPWYLSNTYTETITWVFKGHLREGSKSEKSYSGMQLELSRHTLRYWKRQKNKEPVCLDLLLVWIDDTATVEQDSREKDKDKDKDHKRTAAGSYIFQILGPEQVIKVVAASEEQKESWMETLKDILSKHIISESMCEVCVVYPGTGPLCSSRF